MKSHKLTSWLSSQTLSGCFYIDIYSQPQGVPVTGSEWHVSPWQEISVSCMRGFLKFSTCGQYQEVRIQDHRVWFCWIPLPNACKHAEERVIGWGRGWKMELSSSRFPGFSYIWGPQCRCLFGISIMMTLGLLLAISADHLSFYHFIFILCALWFDLYWTRRVWTSCKGCLGPGISKTFGTHKWVRAD